MKDLNRTARTTGALMLAMAVIAPFGMLYVPSLISAPGADPAVSGNLLRLGMAAGALVFLIEIGLTALIYILLKPVNPLLSLAAAFARLAMTVLQGMNVAILGLVINGGAGHVEVLMAAFGQVTLTWGIFFGLHLLLSGTLVVRSGYISTIPGWLLVAAGVSYLAQSFGNILLPQYGAVFTVIGALSMVELAFPLWLLIRGVRWEPAAPAVPSPVPVP